jgi:hypothetical protein
VSMWSFVLASVDVTMLFRFVLGSVVSVAAVCMGLPCCSFSSGFLLKTVHSLQKKKNYSLRP